MAWNKNKPYAPFYANGDMSNYGHDPITKADLDIIYANGGYQPRKQSLTYNPSFIYRPFKNVHLKLHLVSVGEPIWLKDEENHEYPMFQEEFNRILHIGRFSGTVEGEWSVEKRGQHYGIILMN